MGNGYTIKRDETESAASALSSVGSCATTADSDLEGNVMPSPAAGEGIGAEVKSMLAGWHKALPDLAKEFDVLSKNVKTAATVTIEVEEPIRGQFRSFAE